MKNMTLALVILTLALSACGSAVPTATPTLPPTPPPTPTAVPTDLPTPTKSATAAPSLTPTVPPTLTPTDTPKPSATWTLIPTDTPTSAPITVTMSAVVSSSSDDVNQDGGSLDFNSGLLSLGTASSPGGSYTGLRFARLSIPPDSTIKSAWLMVYSSEYQWIGLSLSIAAEATGYSAAFAGGSLPSQRVLTSHKVIYSSDVEWQADTWYSLGEIASVVQEVVSRKDWKNGNSFSLILKGAGNAWGRKMAMSFDGSPALAPRLSIRYRTQAGAVATATMTLTPP